MVGKIKRFPVSRQPVISLNTSAVRAFMRALLADGTGANSVSKYLSTVRADPNLTHPADPILTRGWALTV